MKKFVFRKELVDSKISNLIDSLVLPQSVCPRPVDVCIYVGHMWICWASILQIKKWNNGGM